ncbi:riboflavin synthase [Sphingomonas jejuensis]|uniref:Riboflavin synthase n=1 Tax=Sphingomonas jejuensis TaxID=904715 RepID=A0ABX0XNY1_9SPHN|nr:riboflavin synthase [Sphingomonas jejuensis]NJC34913.1 riboflavin synthase [Sphingomonas jejuensis]
MFTGIVTDIGIVEASDQSGDLRLTIRSAQPLDGVVLGASIACSGVCLTVVDHGSDWFAVDVSAETRSRSVGSHWAPGARINLERALRVGDELGGHIVTGHVDGTAELVASIADGDSRRLTFALGSGLAPFVAAKGSVTIDGVSLTVNGVEDTASGAEFWVNLISHTQVVTTLGDLRIGDMVNVEIDVLARYLRRMQDRNTAM